MKKIVHLAVTDFKLIFRDPSLRAFLALPVILFVLIIWVLPGLVDKYEFLLPYLSLFLVVAVIENTQMFSFISSMVLIEEKETEVAKVYGVIPLDKSQYIVSRFLIPFFFTFILNVVLFMVQPFYHISLDVNLVISVLAGLVVPVYALAINAIVSNRMQGMVYVKAFNMIVLIPIAAFFVPEAYQHFFGIFPTHWLFQSVDYATRGLSIGVLSAIGYLFMGGLFWFVAGVFMRKHFV